LCSWVTYSATPISSSTLETQAWFFLLNFSFLLMCSYLLNFFWLIWLKDYFVRCEYTTPACFSIPRFWYKIFCPFIFSFCLSLPWAVFLPDNKEPGPYFIPISCLCITNGELRPFIFRVIIKRYVLIPVHFFPGRFEYYCFFFFINLRSLVAYWVEHVCFFPNSHLFICTSSKKNAYFFGLSMTVFPPHLCRGFL
jgi:hypothetical protein